MQVLFCSKNPADFANRVVTKDHGAKCVHTQAFPCALIKEDCFSLQQALQLDRSMKDLCLDLLGRSSIRAQIAIKTQVGLGIDLGFHTFNDMMADMT